MLKVTVHNSLAQSFCKGRRNGDKSLLGSLSVASGLQGQGQGGRSPTVHPQLSILALTASGSALRQTDLGGFRQHFQEGWTKARKSLPWNWAGSPGCHPSVRGKKEENRLAYLAFWLLTVFILLLPTDGRSWLLRNFPGMANPPLQWQHLWFIYYFAFCRKSLLGIWAIQ